MNKNINSDYNLVVGDTIKLSEDVLLEIEDEKKTHVEFDIHYNKDRKNFCICIQSVDYKIEYGCGGRSYTLLGGSSVYLYNVALIRKSTKQESVARAMVTVEGLTDIIETVKY